MTCLMFMTPELFCLYLLFMRKAKHRHLLVIIMLFTPDDSYLQLQIILNGIGIYIYVSTGTI